MQRNDEKDTSSRKAGREFLWFLFTGVLIAIAMSVVDGQAPTRSESSQAAARAIFARHDSAAGRIGGRSPHKHSHTIMEIESSAGFKTVLETWVTAPNRVLTRMTTPGGGMTELGYNGSVGWTTTPFTGTALLDGEPLKQLAKQADGRSILETKFKTLAAGPPTEVEGKRVVPVEYEDDKGNAVTFYFDASTGLMHATHTRVRDSASAGAGMLMVVGDYKRFDGELVATTWTMKAGPMATVTRTTHVDHKPIDTALFSPLGAVREPMRKP